MEKNLRAVVSLFLLRRRTIEFHMRLCDITHTQNLACPFFFFFSFVTLNQKFSSHDQIVEFESLCGIVHLNISKKKYVAASVDARLDWRTTTDGMFDEFRVCYFRCVCVEITKENWSREREGKKYKSLSLGGVCRQKRRAGVLSYSICGGAVLVRCILKLWDGTRTTQALDNHGRPPPPFSPKQKNYKKWKSSVGLL